MNKEKYEVLAVWGRIYSVEYVYDFVVEPGLVTGKDGKMWSASVIGKRGWDRWGYTIKEAREKLIDFLKMFSDKNLNPNKEEGGHYVVREGKVGEGLQGMTPMPEQWTGQVGDEKGEHYNRGEECIYCKEKKIHPSFVTCSNVNIYLEWKGIEDKDPTSIFNYVHPNIKAVMKATKLDHIPEGDVEVDIGGCDVCHRTNACVCEVEVEEHINKQIQAEVEEEVSNLPEGKYYFVDSSGMLRCAEINKLDNN